MRDTIHTSNAIHDTRTMRPRMKWEPIISAIFASAAIWAVVIYLFFYHV